MKHLNFRISGVLLHLRSATLYLQVVVETVWDSKTFFFSCFLPDFNSAYFCFLWLSAASFFFFPRTLQYGTKKVCFLLVH